MSEKIFCGSGKVITTKYGPLTKISFREDDLNVLRDNLNNGWVNLVLKEKKNKTEGKPTHYLEVDKWEKPSETKPAYDLPEPHQGTPEEDDLPF